MADANILGRTLRFFTSAFAYAREPLLQVNKAQPQGRRGVVNPAVVSFLTSNARGASTGNDGKTEQFATLAYTNPAFYGSVRRIANRVISSAKFNVEEQDAAMKWMAIENHPFLDTLQSPNAFMGTDHLLGELVWALNTYGNGYWFLSTDSPGVGPVREIWPLPPDKTQPDPRTLRISPLTGKPIVDFTYTLSNRVTLPGENIVHFRTPNLTDFWMGMSPMTGMQAALRMDAAETNWLASFFSESNAVPTAVISVPPDLRDEEFDAVKADIISNFGGQRGVAITRAGDMEVQTIQHTIEEMQVLAGLEYNKGAVYGVLGVPLGIDAVSSGQSLLAAEMALMRDAVQPMLDLIASSLSSRINYFYGSYGKLRVVAEDIVPQDTAVATAEYTTYGADRTLNENRVEQKLPPLQLSGDWEDFQPLFDDVPQRYVELFFAAKQQAMQPQVDPLTGMPIAPQGLPGAPTSPQSIQNVTPGAQNPMLSRMLGDARPKTPPKPGMARAGGPAPAPKPQGNQPVQLGQRTTGLQRVSSTKAGDFSPDELDVLTLYQIEKTNAVYYARLDGSDSAAAALYQKSLDDGEWRRYGAGDGWVAIEAPATAGDLREVSAEFARRFVYRQAQETPTHE